MVKFSNDLTTLLRSCEQVGSDTFSYDERVVGAYGANYYAVNVLGELTHLVVEDRGSINLNAIVQCRSLEWLELVECGIEQIPDNIVDLQKLSHLHLSGNEISTLPVGIDHLKELSFLDLSRNQISELPASITRLAYLNHLNLRENCVNTLPENIGDLDGLNHLNLGQNQIRELPDSIGLLGNLDFADFSDNLLDSLPDYLGNLNELKECFLSNNSILDLPNSISLLRDLEILDLQSNRLEKLPDDIGELQNLNYLNLDDNELIELPNSLVELSMIGDLSFEGNRLCVDDKELQNLSTEDKVRTILKIQEGSTTPLNEAKVLVVGEERVGKTSLISRLAGLPHDPNQSSTEGINISHQQLENGIQINIWDFAGQEITHQTHKFFLSNRSLYLLVLDSQKEDNDASIYHWLSVIRAYGGEYSPIIVVVNHRDKNQSYFFDFHRYLKEFNIVDVLYTSACNKHDISPYIRFKIEHSIEKLHQTIKKRVSELKGIDFPLPNSWTIIKNTLQSFQKQKVDFIQKEKYESLCREHGVTDPADQITLLKLLNEIGTVVAYPEDRRLRLTQVVNPLWVTNGVYKIIRSGMVKNGILSANNIERILKYDYCYDYSDTHLLWLMDLLNQFELSFSIDVNTLLLPSKLSNQEPAFNFAMYQQGLSFRFRYQSILKKSVIWQLIVKLHHHIDRSGSKYWRRGAFFIYGDSKAVVIADENKKTIDIQFDSVGRSARELLTIIRERIKEINGKNLIACEELPLVNNGKIVGYTDYCYIATVEQTQLKSLPLPVNNPRTGEQEVHTFELCQLLDGYKPEEVISFDYHQLTTDLLNIAAKFTESRHAVFKEQEDLINDRFRDGLVFKGYSISDQSRGGESAIGRKAGERDIVVRNQQGIAVSIIEALILKNCNKANIKKHYDKLTLRYDTLGNERNFILVYAKTANFDGLWSRYCSFCNSEFNGLHDTSEHQKRGSNIRTGRTLFEGGEIFHLFVNFYSTSE